MASPSGIINQARAAEDPNVLSAAADSQVAAPAPSPAPQTVAPAGANSTNALAPTPVPTPAPAPAPVVATSDDVNAAYNSLFGRPAEAAGLTHWSNLATKNGWTADQLKQQIAQGAQNEDVAAARALGGAGSLDKNWQQAGLTTNNLNTSVHWDGKTNQWVNAATPSPVSTYTPTLLGTPTQWNITSDQTTAGQLAKILDPNSPIIRQAMTQGLELANERGLLNSSIAQGAAQNAAYAAAVPIASSDAATYSKAAGYNADQSNQFAVQNANYSNAAGQFNANQQNDFTKAQLSSGTQQAIAQLQAQTQTNLGYLDNQTKNNLAQLDSTTRVSLANIEANYHQLMQTNQSASDLFRQVTQNITNISLSKDMDASAKQAAVDNQLKLLQNGLGVNGAVSNLNLGNLLDFSGINNGNTTPTNTGGEVHP